ncbi:hypothetical protein HA402_009577 [Bradysia odoriphaga]|nr:hypothetical protein HA402_009577 [Bradysia odoriphaga]
MFLNYFVEEHSHKFIRSSPVIPFCDPTVPFVNAGMNQFKNIFLGKATPACNAAANSQKCIRAGGKHNDLSIIGTDGYHHTFFEMLGNWSFGDYFKDKACRMAWDLLTNVYKIESSRLYVTYFGGDAKLGLEPDFECKEIWQSIGVPVDRILPFGMNDNFWEMGATGPCGSCTEIHIDHLPNSDPMQRARFVNAGLPDLTELWNVVFIEYNRNPDGTLEPLKQKFIDTGMGFERLVAVLQGQSSNYDTDLFLPIFDAISKESGKIAYSGVYNPQESNYELDFAYRLVADHVRMSSVCIADGMYPQTNHRLRKIMRKASNVCDQKFQKKNLIQNAIIPKIVESLGSVYPELEKNSQSICDIFRYEDELFKAAVENNRKKFKLLKIPQTSKIKEEDTVDFSNFTVAYRDVEKLMKSHKQLKTLPVEFVCDRLSVTRGLNDDLIQKLADEMQLKVDMDAFHIYKNEKKLEAKSRHQIESSYILAILDKAVSSHLPATVFHPMYDYAFDEKARQFNVNPIQATVAIVEYSANDDTYHIILDRTNFYHTAGGQDSDIGQITTDNSVFEVENVGIHKDYVVHSGRFVNGTKPFQANERVNLQVDPSHRTQLSQHHTTMHLLQAAMKHVTNRIVFQESSRVSASNLKCQLGVIGKRIKLDQLESIEKLVCKVIQSSVPIDTQHVAAHELYAMSNLTTLPGATYPDNDIRVLRVKDDVNEFESIEPCCGTHASNTSQLEDFRFTSFKVNNSSSYQITAVAGRLVEPLKLKEIEFLRDYEKLKEKICSDPNDRNVELEAMESQLNQLKRQLLDGQLPYITSARVLSEMEKFDKQIRVEHRSLIRQSMVAEIVDVLASRKQCVVHVLETKLPLEEALLAEALSMCNDLPVILLNVSDNRIVGGRASIPLNYVVKQFDAKDWLTEMLRPFKMKCTKAKHKNSSSQSSLKEISDKSVEPAQLKEATERTKALGVKMFSRNITADENRRFVEAFQLKKDIQDYRSRIKKIKSLDDVLSLTKLIGLVRENVKHGLYSYDLKKTCSAELAEINNQIVDAQHEIERKLYDPDLERAISSGTLNKKPCIFHVISTRHPLHPRTIMRMTDTYNHLPLVLIVISGEVAIGRITIPMADNDRNLTAKELSDEICMKFDGTIHHHGRQLGTSVCDFQLKSSLINEANLKEMFQRIENLVGNAV